MDLHEQLAKFNERIGKDPIDGTKIQGFEEGTAPVPEFVPRPPVDLSQVPDAPAEYIDEDPDFEEEPSPLIPRTTQTPVPEFQQNLPQPAADLPKPDFAIVGMDDAKLDGVVLAVGKYVANYLGRQVELSENEKARAQALVRGAISRALRAELAELRPKRRRAKRTGAGASPGAVSAESRVDSPGPQPAPKKRGRKPKQRLDGSVS
jgi:hypothetical protein